MEHQFVTPNWHVILIHYPLGLITIGVLIELLAFLWLRSTVRNAGKWMILLGTLACIPAVTTGLFAFADVAHKANPNAMEMGGWGDVTAGHPWSQVQWDYFKHHIWYEASGTAVMVLACLLWLGASEATRRRAHPVFLLLCVAGLGLMVAGAWYSGEDVYRFGSATMADPAVPADARASAQQAGVPHFENWRQRLEYFVPPLQAHTLMAGLTVAVAVGALGMALRAMNRPAGVSDFDARLVGDPNAPAAGDPNAPPPDAAYLAVLRGAGPERATDVRSADLVEVRPTRLPVGRFWLLACVLGLITAGGGLWVLTQETNSWQPKALWGAISGGEHGDHAEHGVAATLNRRVVHVALGVSIVVLTLLLAGVGRWTARRRGIVSILALLLVLVVAAQIWMGILLLYDGHQGPLARFNKSSAGAAAPTTPSTAPTTAPGGITSAAP